ncbi:MAG: sodium:solute symporter family protein [Candidatus Latescibacteria bacterium]|nr:sodium:solute symporter family protein [Candidatus Latescibacterota bacterium]
MNIHLIPLILLIGYTIITIGAANIVLKKKLGSDHFLVAGRALPLVLVIAVVLGDWVGGNATIGVSQRGYTEGILGSSYSIALGIAMFVFASTMSARFRRLNAVTIPEVVGRLFDGKTRLMAAIVIGVAYFIAGITQIIAGGALLAPLLGVDKWMADLIAAMIFTAIITAGGLRSIALVNVIQMGVIFVGICVSLVFSLSMVGGSVTRGLSRLLTELPSSYWSVTARNPLTLAGEVVATVFTCFAGQAAITGIFAAKDTKAAVRGAWIVGFLLIPIGIAFALLGMCARVHFGEALPYGLSAAPAMMLALNPVIAGISMCGLFAAIISTGPLCFLAPTQILIRDIYSVYIDPDAPDKTKLVLSRALAVILLVSGGIIAVSLTEVLKITYWGFAFRVGIAVILLSVTFLGARRITEDGAFYGLIAGVAAFIVWNLLGSPYGLHVGMPTALTVFVATVVISRFRNRKHDLTPEVREAMYPEKN